MVEHVTAREKEDGDQANGRPDTPILYDGEDIRPGRRQGRASSQDDSHRYNPFHPVNGSSNWGVRSVGKLSRHPVVHLLCSRRPGIS